MVATIRANNKIPVALHDAAPGPALGVLNLLHCRSRGRRFANGNAIGRKRTGILATKRAHTRGQAHGKQGLSHGYPPDTPRII
jgi:hypothetical protein